MKLTEIKPGLNVLLSEGMEIGSLAQDSATRGRNVGLRPGVEPMPAAVAASITDVDVIESLKSQDMELLGAVPVRPSATGPGVRARTEPPGIGVEIDLGPDEGAVVLLEQDGLFAWQFESTQVPAPGSASRGPAARRRATFFLPLGNTHPGGVRHRGWITDFVVGPAVAFVFKFAGRFLLGRGVAFLERKIQTGVVLMDSDAPTGWRRAPDFSALQLPNNRPARILLFVHGTFSSTVGGFAQLCVTPWGREFLKAARANYDAVVGFDHPTLSVDPLANANAIMRSLESRDWARPATIDAISHSRGGITLRSLVEHLLPAARIPVKVDRSVFVGAVNGGTELAEPGNWRTFINFYTNIAVGAARAVAAFPQVTFVASLTAEILKGVGVLAKVLAEEVITNQAVPGLAAMQPSGPFITELNKTQPGQSVAAASRYYAITSDFRAKLAFDSIKELPQQFLRAVADGAADQFMKVANDLVVNTDSMMCVDPHAGNFMKDTLAFGTNGVVYHTNYFLQPQVVNALARWLNLASPSRANPERNVGAVRGESAPIVPARMDTDLIVVSEDRPAAEVRKRVQERNPSYVVVERFYQGARLHYAFQAEEVLAAIEQQPGGSLQDVLQVHEFQASPEGPVNVLFTPRADASHPSMRRTVAIDRGRVVGVAEAGLVPISNNDMVAKAASLTGPSRTRMMPTFSGSVLAPVSLDTNKKPRTRAIPVARGGDDDVQVLPLHAAKVDCHFLAEMNDEVVLNEDTSVDVTISREIAEAVRAATARATVAADVGRKMIIEIIPKRNFIVVGPPRAEVDVPESGRPVFHTFDLQSTSVGDGEVLIRARQGMEPLVSLLLKCRIVPQRTRLPKRMSAEDRADPAPTGPQPRHQLTIFELERGGKKLYQFILDSPELDRNHVYESQPLNGDPESYIRGIYDDIEQRYLSEGKDFERFQRELRRIGAGLWDQLIPEQLKADLWKNREKITSIQVYSEEPFIPWELVHLKEPGMGLPAETRFLGQMGMVRWLHNVSRPPVDLFARPGKCWYVIPKYPHPNYALPEAELESVFLQSKFQAMPVDPHTEPVETLLETRGSFDLLHFACHGAAESNDILHARLLLEGRVDVANNYVTEMFHESVVEQLPGDKALIGTDGVRPIVTLNACQAGRAGYKMTRIGGFPRAFLRQGAGVVISALWAVGDKSARHFTEELYRRLLANDTLAQATIAGREAARQEKEATWLSYAVYGNPHATLTL